MTSSALKWVETKLGLIKGEVKAAIAEYANPAMAAIEANGGTDLLQLAETLINGMAAATPWGTLETQLVAEALKIGKTIEQEVATIALNMAQSKILAAKVVLSTTSTAANAAAAAGVAPAKASS